MEIVYSDQVAIAAGCLDAKLNRGRMSPLHGVLDDIWDGGNIGRHRIVGAVVDGVYVGCASFTKRTKLVQVFVAESHRRQGIGTALIETLLEFTGVSRDQCNSRPDDSSQEFFDKNLICELLGEIPISRAELAAMQSDPREASRIVKRRQQEYRKAWLERVSKSKSSNKE